MKVAYASIGATPNRNDDRVFITDNAVLVMDGATQWLPDPVDVGTYVDTLGPAIVHELATPDIDLRDAVGNAIAFTAATLNLEPGNSPSSTVSIVRVGPESVDVFALGDSPIIIGFTDGTTQRICDDRLAKLHFPARDAYKARLAAGHPRDTEHFRLLAELQQQQLAVRNAEGGYWIAEADYRASSRGTCSKFFRAGVSRAVLLTDGATFSVLDQDSLCALTTDATSATLAALLEKSDSVGYLDPSLDAKTQDDRTVAAVSRINGPMAKDGESS